MSDWLIEEILPNEQRIEPITELVYQRFRELQIEPPTTGRVERLIRSAIAQHETDFCQQTLDKLTPEIIEQIDIPRYYEPSEEIPIDGVLKSNAKEILLEIDSEGNERINRINYEICVLKALRERLCCKEIWVVGANRYRNPDDDLPTDFESKRQIYYQALTLPEDVETFIRSLQQQMEEGLEKLDKGMPKNRGVAILSKGNKGLIRLSPFDAAPEPVNIKQLKGEINRLWHKTSLLDILKETDLRVNFTRNFKSMGTREILDRETLP